MEPKFKSFHKRNIRGILFLAVLLWFSPVLAQQNTVEGRVFSDNGEPLSGATVKVKGTTQGTLTDETGFFKIGAAQNAVLEVSSLGHTAKDVVVIGRQPLSITLARYAEGLSEVVVTALGIKQETKRLSYASQTVDAESLTDVRDPNNFINSFQGKIAGVSIRQASGGVGSRADIILRGSRSIDGNNSALFVVDGVPADPESINPDDIESVNVLRGASGAALYGSDAGNGVIIITTKKGRAGQLSVRLNSGLTVESPFVTPDVQNIYGQGSNGQMGPANSGQSWGAKMEGQNFTDYLGNEAKYSPQPDNIKDFFQQGISLNNSVSVSGGGEKTQGYLSYTHSDQKGIIPNNKLVSHNIDLRVSHSITKRLSVDGKITYFTQERFHVPRDGEGNRVVLDIYNIQRNISLAQARNFELINELGVPAPTAWPNSFPYLNPYWLINYDINNIATDKLSGFLHLKYQLTDWLSVTGRLNLTKTFDQNIRNVYNGTAQLATKAGGYFSDARFNRTAKWYDVIIQGKNQISQDWDINYDLGAIYTDNVSDNLNSVADGLLITNKFSINFGRTPLVTSSGTRVQKQSLFGQANIGFKNALYLNGSIRNDWDSRLPAPYSYSYYSTGLSAVISGLLDMPEFMSFLKVSLNYSEVGNGGKFGLLDVTYKYQNGVGQGYLVRNSTYPIAGLKPEIVQSTEANLEAGLFKNKFRLTLSYYKSNSKNQLLTIGIPSATGFQNQYINAGNIENSGIEAVLSTNVVTGKSFNWNIAYNLGINRNKVISLSENLDIVYLRGYYDFGGREQIAVGGSFNDITGYGWARNNDGDFLVDANGKPITDKAAGNDPKLFGNFNPDAIMGLSNTFTYKRISARILIDGRLGGIIVNGTEMNLAFSGLTTSTLPFRDGGWNLQGVDQDGHHVNATIGASDFWQTVSSKRDGNGEFFVYDGTNFRVRELSLGYSIPLPGKSIIKSANVSLVARNLLWLYRGKSKLDIPGLKKRKLDFDPDMTLGGVVYGQFPSIRSVGINLNLTF